MNLLFIQQSYHAFYLERDSFDISQKKQSSEPIVTQVVNRMSGYTKLHSALGCGQRVSLHREHCRRGKTLLSV